MNPRPLVLSVALLGALTACGTHQYRVDRTPSDADAADYHAATKAYQAENAPAAPQPGGDEMTAAFEAMLGEMTEEERAMFAAWGPFMTPGTQHAGLAAAEGRWRLRVEHWMAPDQPPQVSTAISEFETFGEGRYLIERTEGEGPTGPFKGHGITGFNNRTKKYFNLWIDNMGTGLMLGEGEGDANARSIRYEGTMDDPAADAAAWFRAERRVVNENTFLFEMWMKMDGKEVKTMLITYTRI